MTRWIAALVMFAAHADARAPRRRATPATCRAATSQIYLATLAGARVTLCFEARAGRTCWGLDLAKTGAGWSGLPATALPEIGACGSETCGPAAAPALARFSTTTTITTCAPDHTACRTMTTPSTTGDNSGLATSADRGLLALIEDHQITVFDTRTSKIITTIAAATWNAPTTGASWRFRGARFFGRLMLVERTNGGASTERWFDVRTGSSIADVAGGDLLEFRPSIEVGGQIAAATFDGASLALHDPRTGKAVRTISMFGDARPPAKPHGLALFAATSDHKVGVAVRSEADGAVAVFDAAAGTVQLVPGPVRCP